MILQDILIELEDDLMTVVVDLLVTNDYDSAQHPDDPAPQYMTTIEILKTKHVYFRCLDKEDIDITQRVKASKDLQQRLENTIHAFLEGTSVHDLKTAA